MARRDPSASPSSQQIGPPTTQTGATTENSAKEKQAPQTARRTWPHPQGGTRVSSTPPGGLWTDRGGEADDSRAPCTRRVWGEQYGHHPPTGVDGGDGAGGRDCRRGGAHNGASLVWPQRRLAFRVQTGAGGGAREVTSAPAVRGPPPLAPGCPPVSWAGRRAGRTGPAGGGE